MQTIQETLATLPYYDKLTENEKSLISSHISTKEYKKGTLIHTCDKNCLGQITVLQGIIRIYIVSQEGREVTLYRLFPGDTCVMAASCIINQITFDTYMTADEDSKIMIIASGTVLKLKEENIYVKCYIYERLSESFSNVMWTMQQILFLGYDKRLASFLISEYERTGKDEIHMSQDQIASLTSSAREVVARMMKRFSEDGLVDYKRGNIKLINIKKLKLLL